MVEPRKEGGLSVQTCHVAALTLLWQQPRLPTVKPARGSVCRNAHHRMGKHAQATNIVTTERGAAIWLPV